MTPRTRSMSSLPLALAACVAGLIGAPTVSAATLVYEGRLEDGGRPARGRYDLRLTPHAEREGTRALTSPIDYPEVDVRDGAFRVEVEIDDAAVAAGTVWMALAVRDAGSAAPHEALPERTAVKTAAAIGTCWSSTGDSGSDPAVNFLGTLDEQPLVLRANNRPVARFEPYSLIDGDPPVTANVVAGGADNVIADGRRGSTIAGGGSVAGLESFSTQGPNRSFASYASIGGGLANTTGVEGGMGGTFATVGGGQGNAAEGFASTVGGGQSNTTVSNATTVSGGRGNIALGEAATVVGGEQGEALGPHSTVAGGLENCAGAGQSWAGGSRAKVRPSAAPAEGSCAGLPSPGGAGDIGSFVWADSQATSFVSTGANQFLIRAGGGMALNTNTVPSIVDLVIRGRNGGNSDLYLQSGGGPVGFNLAATGSNTGNAQFFIARYTGSGAPVDLAQFQTDGRFRVFIDNPVKPTSGSWAAPSDARLKRDVEPLGGVLDRLLQLEGVRFAYREDAPGAYFVPGEHVGFVAQQVERVFPDWVATDPEGYRLVAPKGFEALTVEALRELRAESAAIDAGQSARLAALEDENRALREELAALRAEWRALRTRVATPPAKAPR